MFYPEYKKTTLKNGLILVSEKIPWVRSASIGVWIKSGTRQETKELNGIAHFLEHMLFKGTEKRTGKEIAQSLESLGGYLNAFTGKEQTCYYAEILDEHISKAIDILADMICYSVISEKDIEKEQLIIIDEIESVEDTPEDLLQDLFIEKLFPDNSLGFPILGSKKSISQITRKKILEFYSKHYVAQNIVIAVVGNIDHNRFVDICSSKFHLKSGNTNSNEISAMKHGQGEYVFKRSITQTHICFGTIGLPYNHHKKYELLLINTILGVGMGSRLFQNIREKYGVAYTIYSYLDFFRDKGLLGIYLGTEKNKKTKAINLLEKEIKKLAAKPLSMKELNQVKSQLKGNIILNLENTTKRMNRLAKMEIYLNQYYNIEEVLRKIDAVDSGSIFKLTTDLLNPEGMLRVSLMPD